ncbi:tetratricopeptide repeat protein [Streptomyces sp. BRB081]|nr:tetratricopeptide repeat protein [Streptomyces sp. BRB081]
MSAPGSASAAPTHHIGGIFADHGSIAVGYAEQVHHHAAPRAPASWPHQVGVLPPRALSFQHRAEVDQLRTAVDGGGTAVLSQVLTGTGGVGKTQLAADYARTAWDSGSVDVLVWISASSRSAITNGYAQAGVEVLGADPTDTEKATREFLAWLEPKTGTKPCRWLVVLDDLADPADLRGLWPPASPRGRTLVTTRRRDAALTGAGRRLVHVGLFMPWEAAAYLTEVLAAHDHTEPAEQINALAADLGHLPLALAQAAAYLVDAELACADYRELFADRMRKLADLLPESSSLPDDQAVTVAATWSLSIERADQLRPAGLARPMIQLAAMLDPNGIPATVLTSQPALAHVTEHRTSNGTDSTHQAAPVSAEDAVRALRALHRLSLIDHSPPTPHQAVRVHQLIQRATRDALTPDQHDRVALTAADALSAAWPDVERDTGLARTLRANVTALTHTAEDALYLRSAPHRVLFRAGRSLGQAGQVTDAIAHFDRLTEATRHRLGPDHTHALGARNMLARWRGEAGDAAGAVAAFEELLADQERSLGPDHTDTLMTRRALAGWRGEAGDAAGAAAAFEELLADPAWLLGPDSPDTLAVRDELARWRGEAGDAAGAAAARKNLLADRVRVLGPDHPDTLSTRHELARWRGMAGDAAGAAAALEELLPDQERVMGPDHPDTLTARHELARWQGMAGDAAGAAAALEELLPDQERVLDPDHFHTLVTRYNLADMRGVAGDVAGAAAAFEELLPDQERVMGPDHPNTLNARGCLANSRGMAGDAAGAAAALEELLPDQERVMGPDHPDTLNTEFNLAWWRGAAGDTAALEELLADRARALGPDHLHTLIAHVGLAHWRGDAQDATGPAAALKELLAPDPARLSGPDLPDNLNARNKLARLRSDAAAWKKQLVDQVRVLGPGHPRALVARHELAELRGKAGDAAGAVAAFQELLADRTRVLGPDHPDTLLTRYEIAGWRATAGDAAGAVAAFQELLAAEVRVLGPDHPDTLMTRYEIAGWRGEAGDGAGALAAFRELLIDQMRVLGPDHPKTLSTRRALTEWQMQQALMDQPIDEQDR